MNFKDFKLDETLLKAIDEMGYTIPTPIQEQAIPHILSGKDLLGCAQTGTGKTAAFALPLIQHLLNKPTTNFNPRPTRILILTPTRELAIQIRDNFREYGKYTNLKCSVIFGGVNQSSQVELLKKGVDVIVATPGRLLDLINQKYAKLGTVDTLVLDEADTMLDMGFLVDVKKIIAHVPATRQTLLFSATMPKEINALAETFLKNPVTVKVNIETPTIDAIKQRLYYVDKGNKSKLLMDILKKEDIKSVLVFTRTKHGANKLSETLKTAGIESGIIHGNKSQNARVAALTDFKSGKTRILVATDIAARGIDISELSHVINYEMPDKSETYVHRIGRTGRAGFDGTAISLVDFDEKSSLKDIEKLIKQDIKVVDSHNFPMMNLTLTPKASKQGGGRSRNTSSNKPNRFSDSRRGPSSGGPNRFNSNNRNIGKSHNFSNRPKNR